MVIDFSGGITESRVQEMIDAALDFTTGVINLSNATADQVKTAFSDPDRWLCSVTYSGSTYLEQFRQINTIYFYVPGAAPTTESRKILDYILKVRVTPSTGEVTVDVPPYDYVPNIIYDLDMMNPAQLAVLSNRLQRGGGTLNPNKYRFSAVWTYNNKKYVYSAGEGALLPEGHSIIGASLYSDNGTLTIMYDWVEILLSDYSIRHHEYSSNIQLTPIQE